MQQGTCVKLFILLLLGILLLEDKERTTVSNTNEARQTTRATRYFSQQGCQKQENNFSQETRVNNDEEKSIY